jgi:hypothetical protein
VPLICDRCAVVTFIARSLRDRDAFIAQSLCISFAIAADSLRNHSGVTAKLLRDRCAIYLQFSPGRYGIIARSLRNLQAFDAQSLFKYFRIAANLASKAVRNLCGIAARSRSDHNTLLRDSCAIGGKRPAIPLPSIRDAPVIALQ